MSQKETPASAQTSIDEDNRVDGERPLRVHAGRAAARISRLDTCDSSIRFHPHADLCTSQDVAPSLPGSLVFSTRIRLSRAQTAHREIQNKIAPIGRQENSLRRTIPRHEGMPTQDSFLSLFFFIHPLSGAYSLRRHRPSQQSLYVRTPNSKTFEPSGLRRTSRAKTRLSGQFRSADAKFINGCRPQK